MKVLLISYYGWLYGGGETYLLDLKSELTLAGHDVRVFSSNDTPGHNIVSDYTFNVAKNRYIKMLFGLFNPISLRRLRRVLTEFEPDVVHINSLSNQMTASICFALATYPTVMSVHSRSTFFADGNLSGIVKYYDKLRAYTRRLLIRNVDLFTCPSRSVRTTIPSNLEPVKILKIGVAPFRYAPIVNYKSLLYVGRIVQEKGVEVLLNAMKLINDSEKEEDLRLKIIGAGPNLHKCKLLAKKLGISSQVDFFGQIGRERLEEYFIDSTILIIPSIYKEPFGLTGIEAMFVGRPVIGSDIGGIPEWLNKRCGYLVPPGDSIILADTISNLLADRNRLHQLSVSSSEEARQYSIHRHAKKIGLIYEGLLNSRAS